MDWSVLAVIFAIATSVVSARIAGSNRAKQEAIVAQQATIDALKEQVDSLIAQRDDNERRCGEQIAELRGKVDALAAQQTEAIAGIMAPQVVHGLVQALSNGDWGPR